MQGIEADGNNCPSYEMMVWGRTKIGCLGMRRVADLLHLRGLTALV